MSTVHSPSIAARWWPLFFGLWTWNNHVAVPTTSLKAAGFLGGRCEHFQRVPVAQFSVGQNPARLTTVSSCQCTSPPPNQWTNPHRGAVVQNGMVTTCSLAGKKAGKRPTVSAAKTPAGYSCIQLLQSPISETWSIGTGLPSCSAKDNIPSTAFWLFTIGLWSIFASSGTWYCGQALLRTAEGSAEPRWQVIFRDRHERWIALMWLMRCSLVRARSAMQWHYHGLFMKIQ